MTAHFVFTRRAHNLVIAKRSRPSRHCEARSAVAIHVPVRAPQWIASFLAMTGQGRMTGPGPNDRAETQWRGAAGRRRNDRPFRFYEARP
jgi:hypothetical protein